MLRRRFLKSVIVSGSAAFCATLLPSIVSAHPVHVSLMEAELNSGTGRLECSLKLRPEDLERALIKQSKNSKYRLEKQAPDKLEADTQSYIQKKIRLRPSKGQNIKLGWVGLKLELTAVWVFFEFVLPDNAAELLDGASLSQACFFELEASQVNTVNIKHGKAITTLHFRRRRPRQTIKLTPQKPR